MVTHLRFIAVLAVGAVVCAQDACVTDAGTCTGRGACLASGCACDPGYGGRFCELICPGSALTPKSTCHGHGTCVPSQEAGQGQCQCDASHRGSACQLTGVVQEAARGAPTAFQAVQGEWVLHSSLWKRGQQGVVEVQASAYVQELFFGMWEDLAVVGSAENATWFGKLNSAACIRVRLPPRIYLGVLLQGDQPGGVNVSVYVLHTDTHSPDAAQLQQSCTTSATLQSPETPHPWLPQFGTRTLVIAAVFTVLFKVYCVYLLYKWWTRRRMAAADAEFERRRRARFEEEMRDVPEESA